MSAPYLILSLDGGGVRYILHLVLLRRLFERFPQLEQRIRLVAGSSAGALVGASLAIRGFARTYTDMLSDQYASTVFASSWERNVYSAHGWYAAMYSNVPLRSVLESRYSEAACRQIGDLPIANGPNLLVTAFSVVRPDGAEHGGAHNAQAPVPDDDASDAGVPVLEWCPRIYHTLDTTSTAHGHRDTALLDAMLQTCAAPTYFPVHAGCVDGGVLANNPSMLALTHAVRFGHTTMNDVRILSLGTGVYPSNLNVRGREADLGKSQWLPHLADMFMEANAEATAVNCSNLLGDGYCRVQMRLPEAILLNDTAAVAKLQRWAEQLDLEHVFAWIERHFPETKL